MPTPGELLARKLNGDTTVTNTDITNATNKFFNHHGVDVHCEISERILKVAEETDQILSISKKRLGA